MTPLELYSARLADIHALLGRYRDVLMRSSAPVLADPPEADRIPRGARVQG